MVAASMKINTKHDDDCGYVFFYAGKRIELYAKTLYDAKQLAVKHFKPPKSKQHMVHGMIAENQDGTPVHHVADF
jgi:hypothetical protein